MTETSAFKDEQTRIIPLEFRGDGFEFFKIWIVNILLTILTLGIYSAWAKVRTNRYFYSNLYLDDRSFRYLASPIAILVGRIIAIVFLVIYIVSVELLPGPGLAVALILTLVMPYLIVRSIAFNHRMSAYRNIQFRFHGTYGEAVMALLVWPLLGMLTLGILYPLALLRVNQFIVNNSAYGTSRLTFNATYRQYAILVFSFIGANGLGLLVGWSVPLAVVEQAILSVVIFGLIFVWFTANATNLYYNSTSLGDNHFDADLETVGLLKVYIVNVVLIIVTLGLYLPAAKVRLARYKAGHIRFVAVASIDDFVAAEQEQVSALAEEMGEAFDFDIGTL